MTGPLVRFPRRAHAGPLQAESWVEVLPDAVALVAPYEFGRDASENQTRIVFRSGDQTEVQTPADEVLAALWPEPS